MTPWLAAALMFFGTLVFIALLWAAAWWAGRTFGWDDEHDTIGPP